MEAATSVERVSIKDAGLLELAQCAEVSGEDVRRGKRVRVVVS